MPKLLLKNVFQRLYNIVKIINAVTMQIQFAGDFNISRVTVHITGNFVSRKVCEVCQFDQAGPCQLFLFDIICNTCLCLVRQRTPHRYLLYRFPRLGRTSV